MVSILGDIYPLLGIAAAASGNTDPGSITIANSFSVKLALFCIVLDFITSIWGLCLAIPVFFGIKTVS